MQWRKEPTTRTRPYTVCSEPAAVYDVPGQDVPFPSRRYSEVSLSDRSLPFSTKSFQQKCFSQVENIIPSISENAYLSNRSEPQGFGQNRTFTRTSAYRTSRHISSQYARQKTFRTAVQSPPCRSGSHRHSGQRVSKPWPHGFLR